MLRGVYIVWSLLPLTLLYFGVRAYIRAIAQKPGREYPIHYFIQALFCAFTLMCAIALDLSVFERAVDMLTFGTLDASFVRWLIYPTMLVLAAMLHATYERRQERLRKAHSKYPKPTNYAARGYR